MLSPNFSLDELILSNEAVRRGIDNTPAPDIVANLRRLAAQMEVVRKHLGGLPMMISSGYRCPALNAAVGGAANSDHVKGLAVDFIVPRFGSVLDTAVAVSKSDVDFDQIIYEFGRWVHLAVAPAGRDAKGELLSIMKGTGYYPGLSEQQP
jgi:zinc D-Ala-D-Ala carboxypeptidase